MIWWIDNIRLRYFSDWGDCAVTYCLVILSVYVVWRLSMLYYSAFVCRLMMSDSTVCCLTCCLNLLVLSDATCCYLIYADECLVLPDNDWMLLVLWIVSLYHRPSLRAHNSVSQSVRNIVVYFNYVLYMFYFSYTVVMLQPNNLA